MITSEDIKLILTGKVDSRAKGSAGHPVVTHPTFALERTYCVICMRPYGYVSQESFKYIQANNIVVVCDDCIFSMGEPPLQEAYIEHIPFEKKE